MLTFYNCGPWTPALTTASPRQTIEYSPSLAHFPSEMTLGTHTLISLNDDSLQTIKTLSHFPRQITRARKEANIEIFHIYNPLLDHVETGHTQRSTDEYVVGAQYFLQLMVRKIGLLLTIKDKSPVRIVPALHIGFQLSG